MTKLTYRIGGMLAGKTLTLDDRYLDLKDVYSNNFRVPCDQIETVVCDVKGLGKSILKIVGKGTDLASVELPRPWAEKAQDWILANIKK